MANIVEYIHSTCTDPSLDPSGFIRLKWNTIKEATIEYRVSSTSIQDAVTTACYTTTIYTLEPRANTDQVAKNGKTPSRLVSRWYTVLITEYREQTILVQPRIRGLDG